LGGIGRDLEFSSLLAPQATAEPGGFNKEPESGDSAASLELQKKDGLI